MNNLIDKDKLCNDLLERWDIADKKKEELIRQVMADVVTPIIAGQPVVEERNKAKWIKMHGYVTPGGDPVWMCSNCGMGVHVYGIEHRSYEGNVAKHQWLACPNCGAMMDGEEQ